MSFELGKISSEVKMAIGSKFTEIWKKHFTLISTSLYSLILIVLEKITESEFQCPEEWTLKIVYCVFYFFLPAVTFFILGIIFQPVCLSPSDRKNEFYYYVKKCKTQSTDTLSTDKCKFKSSWGSYLKAFFPALLWIVILFLDGRYIGCATGNITGHHVSQIVGLLIMVAVVSIGLACACCCKKRYTENITVDEETKKLLEQEVYDDILKQKKKAIWQRLNDEYLADPETISNPIDKKEITEMINRVCNNSREGSADQGEIVMVSVSPQGTSNSSPQETSSLLPQGTSSPLRQGTSTPSPQEI
ncbi:uncharacterized protein LOC119567967 [Chelonia mydas]|uniref:uncharacterized protein LOC119567967 n=1 Tax=Chelonia mydas TaxID=8469 RepID=UPI0018A1FA43|nr:uncharacterized protein LOC119567967 [Chelonia mydas]